jgi:hypothetical protein
MQPVGVFPFHTKWTQQETSICHCQIHSTSTLHPFTYETMPGKRSLRAAIAVIILFAVVFMLFLILVRLFSNEDIGTYRPIRRF